MTGRSLLLSGCPLSVPLPCIFNALRDCHHDTLLLHTCSPQVLLMVLPAAGAAHGVHVPRASDLPGNAHLSELCAVLRAGRPAIERAAAGWQMLSRRVQA